MDQIHKLPENYDSSLTESFRELAAREIGELDTASVFMYLFLRFGAPNKTNKDEYKILFSYLLKFEDLIITVSGSYHQHVYFSLFVPKSRYAIVKSNYKRLLNRLYKVTIGKPIPFMPFASLPFKGSMLTPVLSKKQAAETWKKINVFYEKFFPVKQQKLIEAQLKSETEASKALTALQPFAKSLCKKFKKIAGKEDLDKFYSRPVLRDIPKLQKQCERLLDELKKGAFVRDVQVNIRGYESETNPIKETAA